MQLVKNILRILIAKERRKLVQLILLDIFISIVDILSLALLLWMVKFYIEPGYPEPAVLPGGVTGISPVMLIAVFVLLFGTKNWMGFIIARAQFKFISKIAIRVSGNALNSFQQAKFSEFIQIDSSAHIRNIAFQPFEFSQYILSGVQQIITQLSLILITIIAILLFNAKLFLLLLLILLPPVILVSCFIKRRLTISKKHIQENNRQSFQYLLDALKGYVESNIYHRNEFFLKRFITSRQQFSTYLFDSLALQTMPGRIIEVFAVLGLFILIVIAKWTDNNGSDTLITIGAFMAAAYRIIPGIVKVINISGQMKAYEGSMQELENSRKVEEQLTAPQPIQDIESVTFKNVSFQYETQPVLNNISFTIKKGDFMGITGESGKGKTTLLNLLLGFLPAATGSHILINDIPVDTAVIKQYWPSVAYVRQQKFFIHDTLLRNITLEDGPADKQNLQTALNISGLEKLLLNFPEGPGKIIMENGKNISGGQQQRVAIARALYKDSTVILLDEPFNELDEESTNLLLEHFRTLALSGKIIVMITHDKKSLSYCNKTISLDQK